ncbi:MULTISPECIES: rhomboid family intramembrane serine protease [unclassified Solwaraspora]|uniref:rhomboid family intramembrane serine protease n=1 Tax=unclassified Solwaraspora TaxID=2627926 RepID=UPI00248C8A4A|nr:MULTISPECIES: rhomboid family intramembrane serine protease [unclassified Solwaraspora]WBB97094.1 rhomboid family intramembrane serine protease [Solwaraspora sp. WMMA2059]WBC19004.1 rhomboid family intramembrane serine protease [Solwaraspora sp. WMMA2080]WJK33563.1 rhomboid family intramembrane serine protease [Solwaraspora sp. WMMA2065]
MSDPAPTVPVCYRHTSRETWVRCARCERPICPDCMRDAAVGHQCPECVAEGRRTQRSARTAFGGSAAGQQGTVTKVLIGINAVVALIGVAISGGGSLLGAGLFSAAGRLHAFGGVIGPDVTVRANGAVLAGALPGYGDVFVGIDGGGVYRLITAMFIHYGLLHLLFNMWALWVLGRNLEAVLGPARFLALYLIAGLGGNVAAYLVDPGALSAGASTAVFGLFAAFFIVLRRLKRDTSAVVGILVINLILTFTVSSLSIAGHLGGLITGGLIGVILAYAPRTNRTVVQAVGAGAVLLFLILVTVARIALVHAG